MPGFAVSFRVRRTSVFSPFLRFTISTPSAITASTEELRYEIG